MKYNTVVIFGGAGFIGTHLVNYMYENELAEEIIIADIQPSKSFLLQSDRIKHIRVDVRREIDTSKFPEGIDLIVDLAAVHREPGHPAHEYFETNIKGAENVCAFAVAVECRTMFFTSSIAPYGPSEDEKYEESLTVPITPYGSSKLCAEKIRLIWLNQNSENRLAIVRPGVVFGPGEGGNVTRMVRGVISGRFLYLDNKEIVKSGGYIQDLCRSIEWVLVRLSNSERFILYNFTQDPPRSMEQYVDSIIEIAGDVKPVRNCPAVFILALSKVLSVFASFLKLENPYDIVRVRKLTRSNNIRAGYLARNGFEFQYPLKEAFRHWKKIKPADWEL